MPSRNNVPPWRDGLLMGALTFLGGVLRFVELGRSSFWMDEALTAHHVSFPFFQIPYVVQVSGPLFHDVVRLFYLIFGKDDFWLRVPAALFGTLTIPLFYVMLLKMFDRRAAVWGTVLLALSPFHILYSRELRMYTLATLEALIALYVFEKVIERSKLSDWAALAVVDFLGLCTHNWFLFFMASQGLVYVAVQARNREAIRRGAVGFACIALAAASRVPFIRAQAQIPVLYDFIPRPGLHEIADTFYALAGLQVTIGDITVVGAPWALVSLGWVVLLLLLAGLFSSGERRGRLWRIFMVGSLLPLAMAFITSRMFMPIYLPSRYTLLALPAFLMPIACAPFGFLSRSRFGRFIAACFGALWLIYSAALLKPVYADFQKADWRLVGQWIRAKRTEGDAVWLKSLGGGWVAPDYYLPAEMPRAEDLNDLSYARIFVPMNGQVQVPSFKLGPHNSLHWQVDAIQTFRWHSVVLLKRKTGF